MPKNICKIAKFTVFALMAITVIGCKGGGGGSSGSTVISGLTGGGSSGVIIDDSGSGSDSGSPLGTTHNPEPSSLLLLSSGLAGMFVYAKAKLRSKAKK